MSTETPPRPRVPTRRPGSWLAGFAIVALPSLLWAVASPLSSGADEPAHLIRAASLVEGELLGTPVSDDPQEPRLDVAVPAALAGLPEPACYAGRPAVAADCAQPVISTPLPDGRVSLETTSGRHPPAYYLLVGFPYLLDPPAAAGNYAPRVVSALASAAFLTVALRVATRTRAPATAALGVLAALTPMALHLTGVVNPNGLEVTAAICLWTALLALARTEPTRGRLPTGLLAAAGIAGMTMTLTRPVSALWLALAVVTAVAVARPPVLRAALRDRAVHGWALAGALAAAGSVAWLLVVGNPLLEGGRPVEGTVGVGRALLLTLGRTGANLGEMIGVMGWLDTVLPPSVYGVWLAVVALLVLGAVLTRQWRPVAVLAVLVVAVVAVPAVLGALRYDDLGIIWQGRYTLPLAAGVPLLAGLVMADAGPRLRPFVPWLAAAGALALATAQVAAFALTLRRYVVGVDGPLDFVQQPGWQPPLPPVVLLLAFAFSQALLLAWLAHRARLPDALRPHRPLPGTTCEAERQRHDAART